MKSSFEYRAEAREKMAGNWAGAILITVIYLLVAIACEGSQYVGTFFSDSILTSGMGGLSSVLSLFIVAPFDFAITMTYLSFVRGTDELVPERTLDPIREDYMRIFSTSVIQKAIILVASICTLGILGIYLTFAYAMVPYLIKDYPELTWRDALRTSREMMNGHKWELFCLEFSFIGWILLAIVTCGIGILFLAPYMETAEALYYEDLKKEMFVDEKDEIEDAVIVE